MTKSNLKRVHPPKFKMQVVLEMIKEQETVGQICSRFQIHSSQAHSWKRIVFEALPGLFTDKRIHKDKSNDKLIQDLYRQIGQLTVEHDWLKKKLGLINSG